MALYRNFSGRSLSYIVNECSAPSRPPLIGTVEGFLLPEPRDGRTIIKRVRKLLMTASCFFPNQAWSA
jgi:hypothetical protein